MKRIRFIYILMALMSLPTAGFSQEVTPNDSIAKIENLSDLQWGFNVKLNKRENTAAISVADEKALSSSATNPGNALYGKIAGLEVMQGENVIWSDDPTMYIRGIGTLNNSKPLILVDGFERPMNSVDLVDIESVEVIKDAAALTLYGMRGANGVVYVRTKHGSYDDLKVKVSYQYGLTKPFRLPEFADGFTYANAMNEARHLDGLTPIYSQYDLNDFQNHTNPELRPDVDWIGEVLRNTGYNNQLNASFTGGSQWIRYYSSVNYIGDRGFINPDNFEPEYDAQMIWNRLSARANLDIDVTKRTQLKLHVLGQMSQQNRPRENYPVLFPLIYNVPSAVFPVRTSTNYWGGDYVHINPVAETVSKGYTESNNRALYADFRLIQDLSGVLSGLSAELALGYDNQANYWEGESKTFQQENIQFTRDDNGAVKDITRTVYGTAGRLAYSSQLGYQNRVTTLDGKVNYNTTWGTKHDLKSSLIYHMEENSLMGRNNTFRRQSIIGNALYGLSNKYFVNAALAYSGSSVLPESNQFRFFPALSAAWVASSENFLSSSSVVDYLKIRASWGISGNDLFEYDLDKQFFALSGATYYFGTNNTSASGATEGRLANPNLNCEMSQKMNLGLDLNLWKYLSLTADVFHEKRTNILVAGTNTYSSALGVATPLMNDGEMENQGIDMTLTFSKQAKDWGYLVSGNFMFARNKVVNMNEGFQPYDYLTRTGLPRGRFFGWEALGFFKDQADIDGSPVHSFSQVRPGDVKYKDQNNDDIIDGYDQVDLGYSTLAPEIYYGFSLGFNYKNLSLKADFQGVANYSVVKNMSSMYWPLRNNTTVSDHYMENRWTPENTDAKYPRLSTLDNQNNFRASSIWLESGAYLKLRNVEINYHLPKKVNNLINATGINVFVRGTNLLSIDNIKELDPELMSANYPSYSSYHFGINLEF